MNLNNNASLWKGVVISGAVIASSYYLYKSYYVKRNNTPQLVDKLVLFGFIQHKKLANAVRSLERTLFHDRSSLIAKNENNVLGL